MDPPDVAADPIGSLRSRGNVLAAMLLAAGPQSSGVGRAGLTSRYAMGGQQLLEPSKLQKKEKTESHEFNKQKEQDFKRVLEQVVEQEFKAKECIQQATSG